MGLTKRELFAAMAMQGMMALEDCRMCPKERVGEVELWRKECAIEDMKQCVMTSDALLAELAKEKTE